MMACRLDACGMSIGNAFAGCPPGTSGQEASVSRGQVHTGRTVAMCAQVSSGRMQSVVRRPSAV